MLAVIVAAVAVCTASKAALSAFTESLALELAPFDVRVRLVLPGQAPETTFGQNARTLMQKVGVAVPEAYAEFARSVLRADERPAPRPPDPAARCRRGRLARSEGTLVSDSARAAGADALALAEA